MLYISINLITMLNDHALDRQFEMNQIINGDALLIMNEHENLNGNLEEDDAERLLFHSFTLLGIATVS